MGIGNDYAWDVLQSSYLSMMGGSEWQPLSAWRDKTYNFFAKDVVAKEVDMDRFWSVSEIFENHLKSRQTNNDTFCGLIQGCRSVSNCEEASREALMMIL